MVVLKIFLICWIISSVWFFINDYNSSMFKNNHLSNMMVSVIAGGIISFIAALCVAIWEYM